MKRQRSISLTESTLIPSLICTSLYATCWANRTSFIRGCEGGGGKREEGWESGGGGGGVSGGLGWVGWGGGLVD